MNGLQLTEEVTAHEFRQPIRSSGAARPRVARTRLPEPLDPREYGAEPDCVHWLADYFEPEVV